MKYTQREWDRVVGYGKVPEQYRHVSTDSTDGQDKQGCERLEKQSEKLLKKSRTTQENMVGRYVKKQG